MLNKITIMGRLTKDVELRRTQQGTAVASFSIAHEDDFKGNDGSRQTIFIDCVAWRNTAEYISKYFSKGRMIVLCGRLTIREWTDKDGNKRKSAEIVVDNAYFGDSRPADDRPHAAVASSIEYDEDDDGYPTAPPPDAYSELSDDEEILPF